MQYYNFYKLEYPNFNTKELKASGKAGIKKLTGTLKGVYINQPKQVTTKEGKTVTIPLGISISFQEDMSLQLSSQEGFLFIGLLNQLLSVSIGDNIEISTYSSTPNNGKSYPRISIGNLAEKKNITGKDGSQYEQPTSYKYCFKKEEIPEVEITKNSSGKIVDIDFSKAINFLLLNIRDRFTGVKIQEVSNSLNIEDVPF